MAKSEMIQEIEQWCAENRGLFSKDEIRDAVCQVYEVPVASLFTRRGVRDVSDAKLALTWYLSQLNKLSLVAIAQYLGRDNHTTPLKNNRRAKDLLDVDPYFRNKAIRIYQSLNQLLHERV